MRVIGECANLKSGCVLDYVLKILGPGVTWGVNVEMCFPDTSVLLRDSHVLISLIVTEPKEALQRKQCKGCGSYMYFLNQSRKTCNYHRKGVRKWNGPHLPHSTSTSSLHSHSFFRVSGHAYVSLNSSSSIAVKVCPHILLCFS